MRAAQLRLAIPLHGATVALETERMSADNLKTKWGYTMATKTTRNVSKARNAKASKAEAKARNKASKAEAKARNKASKAEAVKARGKASKATAKPKAKATPQPRTTANPGKGSGIELADNMRIKLNVRENPKRRGTASYDRFQLYFTKKPKTVAEALKAGIWRADLRWDAARNFIELH